MSKQRINEKRLSQRDRETGQYTDSLERVCRCGHNKGTHAAEATGRGAEKSQPCFSGDLGEPCDCQCFKRARKTIGASGNAAVEGSARHRNNGRYNGDGRHWATPPEVFGPLNEEFGFTLDPCATPETAKCTRYFTEADDGLTQDWGRERVFMNPPYGREIYAWARKAREAAERGALVVGLLPASTDLAWWHDDVDGRAEVRYLRGRVRFLTGGPYRASGFFPSVVVIWRPPHATTCDMGDDCACGVS